MRKSFFSALVAGCFLIAGTVVTVYAQLPGTAVRASIPFEFIVNGRKLPAGDYEIKRLTDEPTSMIVRGVNNTHDFAIFMTEPDMSRRIPNKSELVFDRYGDTYFLSKMWDAGEQTGRLLPTSRQERRMEHDLASNNRTPETVAVAVN